MTIATVAGLHDAISVASEDAYETREGDSLNKDRWYERQIRADLRRTPEAQADIAAARAPTAMEVAMQEVDRQLEDVGRELRESAPPPDLDAALSNAALADTPAVREMGGLRRLDPRRPAQAVRGSIRAYHTASGNIGLDTTHTVGGLLRSLGGPPHIEIERADLDDAIAALQVLAGTPPRQPYPALDPANLPPGAVLLTGNEAAHYRRLQDAARASQAAQNALATAGAELRDAFGALCRAIAEPSKER